MRGQGETVVYTVAPPPILASAKRYIGRDTRWDRISAVYWQIIKSRLQWTALMSCRN